jgi:hypothetical protein
LYGDAAIRKLMEKSKSYSDSEINYTVFSKLFDSPLDRVHTRSK